MSNLPVDDAKERALKAIKDYKIVAEMWADDVETDTIRIEFAYPRLEGHIKYMELGLQDVRASDGIRIHYDFERDGYVVEQPYVNEKDMGTYIDASTDTWEEVGFFQSWALEKKGIKL
jgi:hypothetical protein